MPVASLCRALRGARDVWDKQMFNGGTGGRNAIMYAAHQGDMPRLEWMLLRAVNNPKLLLVDTRGYTAYDHAALKAHWPACRAIREAAGPLLASDQEASTRALIGLCQALNPEWSDAKKQQAEPAVLVEMRGLLSLGARASGGWFDTLHLCPLVITATRGFAGPTELLLMHAKDRPSAVDFQSALELAAADEDLVELLLREPLTHGGAQAAAVSMAKSGALRIVRMLHERCTLSLETLRSCAEHFFWYGDVEAVRFLLASGVKPDDSAPTFTVLEQCAMTQGDPHEIMRLLLDAGSTEPLDQAVRSAAARGNARILSLFVERGYKEDTTRWTMKGMVADTAIYCALTGNTAALDVAIAAVGGAQCSPDYAAGAYYAITTCLDVEYDAGKARAVQHMISAGLPMGAKDIQAVLSSATAFPMTLRAMLSAWTPPVQECSRALANAIMSLRVESAQALLQAGADLSACRELVFCHRKETLLTYTIQQATSGDYVEDKPRYAIVKLLLEAGADVNEERELMDWYGQCTALSCAADNGHVDIMQLLLHKGAKITAEVLYASTRHGLYQDQRPLQLLLAAEGCDVNAANKNGETALMWLARDGNWTNCKTLVKAGASLEAKNDGACTVLDYVREEERGDFLNRMRE